MNVIYPRPGISSINTLRHTLLLPRFLAVTLPTHPPLFVLFPAGFLAIFFIKLSLPKIVGEVFLTLQSQFPAFRRIALAD
jgi:hypothetical protein